MGKLLYLGPESRDHAAKAQQARAAAQAARRKAGMGREPATLDALVEQYTRFRRDCGKVKGRTAYEQRLTLEDFAASFGHRELRVLGEADVVRWLATIRHQKEGTRRKKYSTLHGFCKWLVQQKKIVTDPCLYLDAPKVPRSVPKVFEPDEVIDLLEVCTRPRERLIVLFGANLGLRVGEMAALEMGDLDGRMRMMVVRGKGDHERPVPVSSVVRQALEDYLRVRGGHGGPLLESYTHPGHGLSPHTISQLIRGLCRKAGIKRFPGDGKSAHGLRRTCATTLAEEGAPIDAVAELLGHTDVKVTRQHYTRFNASRLAPMVESVTYERRVIGLSDAV